MECIEHLLTHLILINISEKPTVPTSNSAKREEIGDENDQTLTYTQRQWEHRPPSWIQVKPDEASLRVLEWVREQANNAKPKDIISIMAILEKPTCSPQISLLHVHYSPWMSKSTS
jgi:hypothetical protein